MSDSWKRFSTVPIYKGEKKKSQMECNNYGGINLLNIPGKVSLKIIMQRIIEQTEELTGEKQCSFIKVGDV